jgi:hypothetical protein
MRLEAAPRPRRREQCQGVEGDVCPHVSCRYHLAVDVDPRVGSIKQNFPHLELWQMPATCALDVADEGGINLAEVGDRINLTRERVRQIYERALEKVRKRLVNSGIPAEDVEEYLAERMQRPDPEGDYPAQVEIGLNEVRAALNRYELAEQTGAVRRIVASLGKRELSVTGVRKAVGGLLPTRAVRLVLDELAENGVLVARRTKVGTYYRKAEEQSEQ